MMTLDERTLLVVSVLVSAMVGALLLFSSRQNRGVPALAWWGAGDLLAALAALLPIASRAILESQLLDVANAVIFLSYGVFWGGTRVFEGRPVTLGWPFLGAVAWLVVCQFPAFAEALAARSALTGLIIAGYTLACAYEVARGRPEALLSRRPAIVFFLVHAVLFASQIPLALTLPDGGAALRSQLFVAFSLESLVYTVATAFILLAMTKERLEAQHRTEALVDALTGVANRRAFFSQGQDKLLVGAATRRSDAVLLFDLDHFKQINDRYGHPAGDRALIEFSRVATASLRSEDLFARIGGEEFACLLAGATVEDALAVAERVRLAFAAHRIAAGPDLLPASVSIGVATALDCGRNLDLMVAVADQALYRAKALGRNRVEYARPSLAAVDAAEAEPMPRPVARVRQLAAEATPLPAGQRRSA